jgi:hypothetical protein
MKPQAEKSGKKPLLILAGLILLVVLAGIFIPRWLEHPNEKAAKATLNTIYEAQKTYHERYGVYGSIDALRAEKLIDITNAKVMFIYHGTFGYILPQKNGYYFFLFSGDVKWEKWKAYAIPDKSGITGTRKFCINQAGKWRSAPCISEEDAGLEFHKSKFPGW